jgi:hypothetical protein
MQALLGLLLVGSYAVIYAVAWHRHRASTKG